MNFMAAMKLRTDQISKFGLEFAEAKAISNNLDELKKTILSEEMLKYQEEPLWKAEAKARTSEPYRSFLAGLMSAEHKANVAWANLKAAEAKYEALRSLCSLEKMHMKTFEHSDQQTGG